MRRAWVHVEDLQGKGLQSKNDQKAAQEELRKAELEDKPLQVRCAERANFGTYYIEKKKKRCVIHPGTID